jgi:DNA repair exonuclease SbcCD ATPase subunit
MENVTKLEEQELNQLKELQQKQENLISNFGQIEYQIQALELEKEKLVEQLEKVKKEEKTLADALSTKYGNGTINIEEGTLLKQ